MDKTWLKVVAAACIVPYIFGQKENNTPSDKAIDTWALKQRQVSTSWGARTLGDVWRMRGKMASVECTVGQTS